MTTPRLGLYLLRSWTQSSLGAMITSSAQGGVGQTQPRCCERMGCRSRRSAWPSCGRCPAAAQHRRRHRHGRAGRDRRRSPARRCTTRSATLTDTGPAPAHPARRVAGALRGPGRRQPPPPDLPVVRADGRRRLRGRRRAVPDRGRRRGLRDRRGRGHLLGPLPRLRRAAATVAIQHDTSRARRRRRVRSVSESENPAIPSPDAQAEPAADQPGLVAEPARPDGAPPALAQAEPAGRRLRLRRGVRRRSTSTR